MSAKSDKDAANALGGACAASVEGREGVCVCACVCFCRPRWRREGEERGVTQARRHVEEEVEEEEEEERGDEGGGVAMGQRGWG